MRACGQRSVEQPLDLLRTEATLPQRRAAALAAQRRRCFAVSAVVTGQPLGHAMIRERDGAVRALRHGTAVTALHEVRVAATIEQQNRLLAALQPLGDGPFQRRRDGVTELRPCGAPATPCVGARPIGAVLAPIDHVHRRQLRATGALRQFEQQRASLAAPASSFRDSAWRCRARTSRLRCRRARAPDRARDIAASRPACRSPRAPRPRRSRRAGAPARRSPNAHQRRFASRHDESPRQASYRSPSDSAECSTATWSPNALRKRSTVCGVSAISGTSTIAALTAPVDHVAQELDVDERLAAAGHATQQRACSRRHGDQGSDGGALRVGRYEPVRWRNHS